VPQPYTEDDARSYVQDTIRRVVAGPVPGTLETA